MHNCSRGEETPFRRALLFVFERVMVHFIYKGEFADAYYVRGGV